MTADWKTCLLPPNSSVQDAVENLNHTGLKIVLVASESEGTLIGTISDGDIRRGMLKGITVEDPVDRIVNRKPLVVPPELNREIVLQLMQVNQVQQVPVVDEAFRVTGLHLWHEISAPSERANVMIIMAGGKGTRLRPHTEDCPKPLLPVSGRPLLEHIIERARREGFSNFILAINYLGHMIVDHFGNGQNFGVNIEYLNEEAPLGTAGALSLLNPEPELPFLVSNGDVLTDIPYGELLDFHQRHAAMATMAIRLYEWQNPYGVVLTRGLDIVGFEEKPVNRTHVNAGVYALEPEALRHLNPNERCDMPTLFQRLKDQSFRTVAYPMHEPWLDVGVPDDLNRASIETAPTNRT